MTPPEVTLDFDSGRAECPEHGQFRTDDPEACVCVRQFLELRAAGLDWHVFPAGPRVEARMELQRRVAEAPDVAALLEELAAEGEEEE